LGLPSIESERKPGPCGRKTDPEYGTLRNILYKYGVTKEDYNNLYNKQNGCCRICTRHQSEFNKRLSVDHNHETGKVRGLLCSKCNQAIGLLKENINSLENAIEYLKENNI